MNASYEEEITPLISRYGIPTAVRDTRKSYQRKLAVYFILASTLFERIAFFALPTNISHTLKSNKTTPVSDWNPRYSPTGLLYIFLGTSYISTLIFAVISDAKLGRGRTIILGYSLYLIGYTLVTIAMNKTPYICSYNTADPTTGIPMDDPQCFYPILGMLICIAIGAGAVKSNLAVFGAEQIQESKITSRYFDKYVVAVNIGRMIAILVIPPIQDSNSDYFVPYIVGSIMPFLAALFFLIGWRYYIHVKSDETVVAKCIPVIINAFQTRSRHNKDQHLIENENANSGPSTLLNASHSLSEEEKSIRISEQPSSFFDYAKAANGGKFQDRIVDDVKSLRGALVLFSLLVPYWLIYNQADTTFQVQGKQMIGNYPKYVISYMTLGDPVIVIIGVLVLNLFVYKYLTAWNRAAIITTKFVIGMCFAIITICIAGSIEVFRQNECQKGPNHYNLTIFAQIPQNIGIGFSQLFAMVASYEFAYFAAPRSAQSLFMSLHFCSIGISSFIGSGYSSLFLGLADESNFSCADDGQSWIFYTYFYILGGLQFIFIIILIVCQKKFRIIKLNPQQIETNQFLQHSISTTSRQ